MAKAYLVLQHGRVFEGQAIGADAEKPGELVFYTGAVGYMETLSDPGLLGHIIIFTFPQIGNSGAIPEDMISEDLYVSGVVLRDLCDCPSNFRSGGKLGDFLKERGIPGICDVDTRALTAIIRQEGSMSAVITRKNPSEALKTIGDYKVKASVAAVSTKEIKILEPEGEIVCEAAVLDYGAYYLPAIELVSRGARVTVLPHDTKAEDILSGGYDGLVLTGGPGSPSDCPQLVSELSKLLGKLPIFGLCLGHQLLALSAGAETEKLKYGHRGANQPVLELQSGRIHITAQNHGYAVKTDSIAGSCAELSYINLNDDSCEGLDYPGKSAFSLQFFPDGSAGIRGTAFNFDRFLMLMTGEGSD